MNNNFLMGLMFILITLFGSCFEVAAEPATYDPSNQPLMIHDLESATVSFAQMPYNEFTINFRGGTDSASYANDHYFGHIEVTNPVYPYVDGSTASIPTALIVQPSVDEINPVLSQGDTVTITYDGGQVLTVYLPYMDGSVDWDNLFVATDGSTYFYYDTSTDTLKGPAATAPSSDIIVNPHPNEHANPMAFSGKFNSLKDVLEISSQPLMIQDLEGATISFAQIPYETFEIHFRGGTDSVNNTNNHYFGEIPSTNPILPYDDSLPASMPVPLIISPSVDEMNPVFSQGDTITITYDGGQVLTVYLPYMDGSMVWDNLFVATDGSTYFYYDAITDTLQGLAATGP